LCGWHGESEGGKGDEKDTILTSLRKFEARKLSAIPSLVFVTHLIVKPRRITPTIGGKLSLNSAFYLILSGLSFKNWLQSFAFAEFPVELF
jgi:hypothetical protein